MPSWTRNSRIVEFKTERSPSHCRPSQGMARPPLLNWAGYLVWWITIIKYNLKGRMLPTLKLQHDPEKWEPVFRTGHAPPKKRKNAMASHRDFGRLRAARDDCFQDRSGRWRQGPQGAGRGRDR